ncbi:peptidoglycan-binding protein [Pseudoalteromonas sp. GB56]
MYFQSIVLIFCLLIIKCANAHSGRTNLSGCHNNKKTGGYHCHNKKLPHNSAKSYTSLSSNSKSPVAQNSSNEFSWALVMQIQKKLNLLGYDAGPEDGKMGTRTKSAIMAFEKDNKMEVQGLPSNYLLNALYNATIMKGNSRTLK